MESINFAKILASWVTEKICSMFARVDEKFLIAAACAPTYMINFNDKLIVAGSVVCTERIRGRD